MNKRGHIHCWCYPQSLERCSLEKWKPSNSCVHHALTGRYASNRMHFRLDSLEMSQASTTKTVQSACQGPKHSVGKHQDPPGSRALPSSAHNQVIWSNPGLVLKVLSGQHFLNMLRTIFLGTDFPGGTVGCCVGGLVGRVGWLLKEIYCRPASANECLLG